MFNITTLVQKAQSLIDPALSPTTTDRNSSKAALFRHQFRLPDSQNPIQEILAELSLSARKSHSGALSGEKDDRGIVYTGRLHLSESFLCFSTQPSSFLQSASFSSSTAFTGQTQGAGPSGNGFILPLCAIRRVERLHSQNYEYALAITTWNGSLASADGGPPPNQHKLTIQFLASRLACERFCDTLKRGLRDGVREVEKMRSIVADCYSEYLMSTDLKKGTKEGVKTRDPPDAGLGMVFKYPGDARKLRDRSKMRLWGEYLRENGQNLTLVRQPTFHKLIRVGLPNRLRGELWELTSGSLYLRLQQPKLYTETLQKYTGKESLAIDEIEKDLNRSLPEYPGFQSEEGIGRLRRVLVAYSWSNEEVGYCQAMNIVVAALLMLLPGYYSTTMYGTLLDQKVFESLVEKTMPILWDHLTKSDVQLSVVSLPWFLSLYINSMPLDFAFRVLDVFFLEGPKVLFQIGLAILRINGEDLLDAADDGAFISILKSYFARLDNSAHPTSENPKLRAVTRFQELLVVAFKEFSSITQSSISELRSKHTDSVLDSIESFSKRTSIRNLGPESKKLSTEDLGAIYDKFYGVLYDRQQRAEIQREKSARKAKSGKSQAMEIVAGVPTDETIQKGRVALGPSPNEMSYDAFREFLATISKWAITDSPRSPQKENEPSGFSYFGGSVRNKVNVLPFGPEPADHDFMQRLYKKWNVDNKPGLSLQNVVTGLARVKGNRDIMTSISYFFELYDDNQDGKVDREGILRISEALLFLSRRGFEGSLLSMSSTNENGLSESGHESDEKRNNIDERFLNSVSAFIRRCFEYADPDHPSNRNVHATKEKAPIDAFSIGDDEDDAEDLLDLQEKPKASSPSKPKKSVPDIGIETPISNTHLHDSGDPQRKISANLALDPANPLHITLPTFRMVILADELLEQFFESAFPSSFRLAEQSTTSLATSSSSSTLTTFSSLRSAAARSTSIPISASIAPGKGLRGVLDTIVSDGMRVAAEVRRHIDEAQKEMEKNALANRADEEDEEEDYDPRAGAAYAGDPERRSVREDDRDLLTGADAEIEGDKGKEAGEFGLQVTAAPLSARIRSPSTATEKVIEFER